MPQQTTEHGWTIPVPFSESDEDTDDWGEILEAFFDDQLDPEVVLKDTRANQPSAGVEGRWMVIADDSPRPSLEYDDGSSWVTIIDGTATFLEADGSVPMAGDLDLDGYDINNVSGVKAESISGSVFWAQGGTFAAIESALADANANGGTVIVPPGTYSWDSRLVIRQGVTVIAHGATLSRDADIDAMLVNGASSDSFSGYNGEGDITIRGGTWVANNGTYTGDTTLLAFGHARNITVEEATFQGVDTWHQLEFNAVQNGTVQDCTFEDFDATEMFQLDAMVGSAQFPWFGSYDGTACENIIVTRSTFRNGNTAIGTHSNTSSAHKTNRIRDCRFANIPDRAIDALDWHDTIIEGCSFEGTGAVRWMGGASSRTWFRFRDNEMFIDGSLSNGPARGVHIDNFDNSNALTQARISGNEFQNCPNHACGADNADDVIIEGNTIESTGASAIWLYGTDQGVITNNEIKSTTGNVNIGGSGNGTNDIRVAGNNIQTGLDIRSGSDTVFVADNFISSLTNNGTNVQTHDNIINGSPTGYDIYVQSSAPSTSEQYVRFEP